MRRLIVNRYAWFIGIRLFRCVRFFVSCRLSEGVRQIQSLDIQETPQLAYPGKSAWIACLFAGGGLWRKSDADRQVLPLKDARIIRLRSNLSAVERRDLPVVETLQVV